MNVGAFVNVDMAVPEELSVDGNHKHACEVACHRRKAFTTRPQGYVRWQTPSASVRRVESSGACSDGPTFWLGANSLELRPGRIAVITESVTRLDRHLVVDWRLEAAQAGGCLGCQERLPDRQG
jgi:hypothetical protein